MNKMIYIKRRITIVILLIFSFGLHAQDNLNFFKFLPETLSFNKPEIKIQSISIDDYNSSKQKVIEVTTVDYKKDVKKSDSIKDIVKTKYPSIFTDSGCIQLNYFNKSVYKYCINTNPNNEKQYLDFYFVGIDNQLATVCVSPYEGTTYYVIDLKNKISYPGYNNYTNTSRDIIYGFTDYISYSLYIYDLKNKKDITFYWGGSHDIIKDFYLLDDKSLRIKISNNHFDKNYKYISIQFRK
ncbi:MAG TPA: hypothetical protein VIH57_06380 [Bacteroidales bacterium]